MAKLTSTDIYGSLLVQGTLTSGSLSTTGVFAAPLGTALLPSYTFTGDLNTGIYSPSADIIALVTSGTERLRLTSEAGYTTLTSNQNFWFKKNILLSNSLAITNANSSGGLQLLDGDINIQAVNGSNYVTFKSINQRVGIGTTAPSEKLDVAGNINISTGSKYKINGVDLAASDIGAATPDDISTAIANLVDTSPTTLDTLNELAAALGDDPNFATTMATALGNKQPLDADLTSIAGLTGTSGLLKKTAADTWSLDTTTYLSGTVGIANGGTNITTYTAGDILYASAANILSKLAKGTDGQVLKLASGLPAWGTDIDNDTKNTAGSTDVSTKIYLVGASSQDTNPQTYSDNEVYVTSGVLTTKEVQVNGGSATMKYDSTSKSIKFVFA